MIKQLKYISKPIFKLHAERSTQAGIEQKLTIRGRFFHYAPCPCGCTSAFGFGWINRWFLVNLSLMYMPIPKGVGMAHAWNANKYIRRENPNWPEA